jgi:long-chain acyl-CoA synthetase
MPTIIHRLAAWAKSDPKAVAQRYKKAGEWQSITTKEFCDRVYWLALFLESRGVTPQDVGAIFSYNCPEWVHMELATLLIKAKSAGIYPNSVQKEILYILNHSDAKFLSIQNREYFNRITLEGGAEALPKQIQFLITFDGDTSIAPHAISYSAALEEGRKLAQTNPKTLQSYLDQLDANAPAFIIYTSGTTGNPKAALLSHDNLVYTLDRGVEHWKLVPGGGSLFSFLPLCHIAEKLQNLGGGIGLRYAVNYCSKFENVSVELPEVEPTLLLCVPRLWEKMMEGVLKKVDTSPHLRKLLLQWALKVGEEAAVERTQEKALSKFQEIEWKIADRVLLSKIRKALGLGKAQVLVSGAAALPPHVCRWFRNLNLEILEDFGQTESTGVICMTEKGIESAGTVGKAVKGMEVKIAPDGELLTRGRHVFKGYFKDEASTAQTLEGGWLHTGDLAEIDARGLIRIRGRKKEVMKTSGGKMIAPLPIEEALKAAPIISQVCMVGDGRKFLSALITLSETKLAELTAQNVPLTDRVLSDPSVVSEVQKHVDQLNTTLASFEQIKKFAVLSKEFSIAAGEMTPTLKMKRNIIERNYSDVIEELYATATNGAA